MVDLILYPNKRIDKELFFESIQYSCKVIKKEVNLRILHVDIDETMEDQKTAWINLLMEIRHYNFKCKAYGMNNGEVDKTRTEVVPATNEVINVPYMVGFEQNKFRIETDNDLYPLLNYGLQKAKKVVPGNVQGLKNVSYGDLVNGLQNLLFKAIAVEKEDGHINIVPYVGE